MSSSTALFVLAGLAAASLSGAMPVARGIKALPNPVLRRVIVPLTLFTFFVYGLLIYCDVQTRTPTSPAGQVSLQLAYSPAQARGIIDAWSREQLVFAAFELGLDMLFLVSYGLALAVAGAWLDVPTEYVAAAIAGAIFDFAEGLLLLASMLKPDAIDASQAMATTVAASGKFVCLIVTFFGLILRRPAAAAAAGSAAGSGAKKKA